MRKGTIWPAALLMCGCNLFTSGIGAGGEDVDDMRSVNDVGAPGTDVASDLLSDSTADLPTADTASRSDADHETGDMPRDVFDIADLSDPRNTEDLSDAADMPAVPDMPASPIIIPFENQPVSHTVIAEHDFSFVPSAPGAGSPIAGFWNLYPSYPQPDITLGVDTDAPLSADDVVAVTLPSGMGAGERDWWVEAWDSQYPTYAQAYLSMFFKLEGADFENDGGGILLAFLSAGLQGPGEDRRLQLFVDSDPAARASAFRLFANVYELPTNVEDRALGPNIDSTPYLTTGEWHQLELLVQMNMLGASDGKVTIWIDGTTVMHYDDVELQTPSFPGDIAYFLLIPDWRGPDPRDDTDRILFDHIRITGAP